LYQIWFIVFFTIAVLIAQTSQAIDAFFYTSSKTSWVGFGNTELITPADGYIFGAYSHGQFCVEVGLSLNTDSWDMYFVGPDLTQPVVGFYPDAVRWPAIGTDQPGLSFMGHSRGDTELSGQFQVFELVFDGQNIAKFAADFIQYDGGSKSAWNFGSIRFNSDIPITVPEPSTLALLTLGSLGLLVRRAK
jgi:hypothetical protein